MRSVKIKDILSTIARSIQEGIFIDVEKTKVELKDLSTGNDWKSLRETICAFLNSDGGVVICGVRERKSTYKYTGFNRNNESRIIDLQTKFFKDDQDRFFDLSANIFFDYEKLLDGEIVVIFVYPLSEDLKYVQYEGVYYERRLTQDKVITASKLQKQSEYKKELANTRELTAVPSATITDLSLEKINRYVTLQNQEIKKETLKSDLNKAKPFLIKQYFLRNKQITTLGLLVCGEDPFYFLHNRAEVDCFYDTQSAISKDKKIFRNDVISLMEDTFRYIWRHINVGRAYKNGGSAIPEYPEKTIRETINNALAHRDYSINNFVTITVEPEHYISIKNPGTFKEKIKIVHTDTTIPIRRLIPGIPESKNPKLASILKVFDKIESQGRGMAALVNAALENLIDLPYYTLLDNTITLTIPSGQLVDTIIDDWLDSFRYYIVDKLKTPLTKDFRQVLAYLYKSELLNRKRKYTILLSETNNHFDVLDRLKESGLIIEHPASLEEAPVYVLDRVLMKTDFTEELIELLGREYIHYDAITKAILNTFYRFGKYNHRPLRVFELIPSIYTAIHGAEIVAKAYESLSRKVRSVCSKMEEKGVLLRDQKKAYSMDFLYKKDEK